MKIAAPVYGSKPTFLCDLPSCKVKFIPIKPNQEFCCTVHKDEFHRQAHELGAKMLRSKGMKCAKIDKSPRLQRIVKFLSDNKPHTTMAIQIACRVVSVATCISELKKNGLNITTTYKNTNIDGAKVYDYQLLAF